MKEHADYEVFCAEQAHFHYGNPFTRRDIIYYWLRGASGGFMSYLQDTEDSIDSLIIAADKTVRLRQHSVIRAERHLVGGGKHGRTAKSESCTINQRGEITRSENHISRNPD